METENMERPSSARFPNEIWIEIFKHFDIPRLLNISLVCKHWHRLIFTHLANRIKLNVDLDQRKYPHKDIGMVPERHYKHLCLRSFKLDRPAYLSEIFNQLAVHLDTLELEVVSLECQVLLQLLALCTRVTKLCIKAKYFECDDTVRSPRPVMLSAVHSLSFDVENYVSTFDRISFEVSFVKTMPNVKELNTKLYRPLDLSMTHSMAAKLKILKATVSCEAIDDFLGLRLPTIEELDLTLELLDPWWRPERLDQTRLLQDFLLGCVSLKTVLLSVPCGYDQELLTAILTSLPRVELLQLSGGLIRDRLSFEGIEKMKFLKTLSIRCLLPNQIEDGVVPMPSVEKISLGYCVVDMEEMVSFLKRFPNLKSLTFRMFGDKLASVTEVVPLLEELSVEIALHPLTLGILYDILRLVALKKLTIDVNRFDPVYFVLLHNVMALPAMKYLNVRTRSDISPNIASLVAATNPACTLILNDQLVEPASRTLRSAAKRKHPDDSSAPPTDDESHPPGKRVSLSKDEIFDISFLRFKIKIGEWWFDRIDE